MNFYRLVVKSAVCVMLGWSPQLALGQDDTAMSGTHEVVFQPVQSGGELVGCTLVYRAVQFDHVYRNGRPIVIVGNIGVHTFDRQITLALKIGVKELESQSAMFERPYFAYLQTTNLTSSKSRYVAQNGDEGYRLIAIAFDEATSKLVFEMLDTGKVTIGFNQAKGGLDVLVPIDLTVFDAELVPPRQYRRKHSSDSTIKFAGCYEKLLSNNLARSK